MVTTERVFQEFEDYLRVTPRLGFEADAIKEALIQVRERASSAGLTRILVDARPIKPPESEFERYLVGKLISEHLGQPFRVAVLYPPEWINKFMEDTAVGRGASLLVCSDESEALQWLREGKGYQVR